MKVVSIDGKREEKAEHCSYCGEKEHQAIFGCPRIAAITYDEQDGTVTVVLHPQEEPPLAG